MHRTLQFLVLNLLLVPGNLACDDGHTPCDSSGALPSRPALHCPEEFQAQAARPLDSALPGAVSVKTIIDQGDADRVHFQDTETYPVHRAFAVAKLGWPPGMPFVEQYHYPQRRFLLGAVTYYEEPDVWAYEMAPYDTASAEMITKAIGLLGRASFFGDELHFHPTSREQLATAEDLGGDIPVVTTEEIYAGTNYQPLNLSETLAQVRVLTVDELETGYVSPREIAVVDRAPNDISVVAGIVTAEFQTPLSHVNVLSQQRGTPNMALRDARERFAPFEGKWVRLKVDAFAYTLEEVTRDQADAWWEQHGPPRVTVPEPDVERTGLLRLDDLGLTDIPAVGGKAAHFGELRDLAEIRVRNGFAIPVAHHHQFLVEHGFDADIEAVLADQRFRSDGIYRRQALADLRARMRAAPLGEDFETLLIERIRADFPATRMRFRSSTNAEDLGVFTGAGLYSSASGDPDDPTRPVADAVKSVWASLWNFRAFEEREYAGIDHRRVLMAILVHPTYVDETANGVAITANLYDPAPGGEDAFYVNVQRGEESVVRPAPGIVSEQLMYYHFHLGQPATYYTQSNLVTPGTTVLSRRELYQLGQGLDAVRQHFASHYDPPAGFGRLPMEVEFKRVVDRGETHIEIKQARRFPGRGAASAP